MSRLIEDLQKADRISSKPMGFKTSQQDTSGPRPRLIVRKALNNESLPELKSNADAVLLVPENTIPSAKTIKSVIDTLPKIPWGIYLGETDTSKVTALIKAGCDFMIFTATGTVAGIPLEDDVGKILEIEASLDDGLVRAINNLPVDAVLVTDSLDTQGPLVWRRLMIFRHLTSLLSKPVIVQVSADSPEGDIRALWDTGADGMIVDIDNEKPERLTSFRAILDKLPPRTSPGGEYGEALLPYSREVSTAEPEPEEDDEDWE